MGTADSLPGADGFRDRCDETAELTAAQVSTLSEHAGLVGPVPNRVVCELAAGHDDLHAAFIVASDEGHRPWWLLWSHACNHVVARDWCADEVGQDTCLLPTAHPGNHSFDLAPYCARPAVSVGGAGRHA